MIRLALVTAPLDPDAQEARRLLLEELADPRYRAAEPNWFDRLVQAVRDWFTSLTLPGDGVGVPLAALIGVLVLVVLVVVVEMCLFQRLMDVLVFVSLGDVQPDAD